MHFFSVAISFYTNLYRSFQSKYTMRILISKCHVRAHVGTIYVKSIVREGMEMNKRTYIPRINMPIETAIKV